MARRNSIRYEPDFAGLGRVMRGQAMQAMLADRAHKGLAFAVAVAPVDSGDYRRSFRVESSSRGQGRWSDRAEARLVNTDPKATLVEYKNGARVLGRAVDVIERG